MSEALNIVAAYPVDFDDCPDEDWELYDRTFERGRHPTLYPASVVRCCSVCGIRVFVGPRSQEKVDEGALLMCMACAVRTGEMGSLQVVNIGGRDGMRRDLRLEGKRP